MDFQEVIASEFKQAAHVLEKFMGNDHNLLLIEQASKVIADSINNGGKIISCGNGGSHCDAMHFAEELTGRYRENRRAIPALCISDPSHISCVSNDFGYEFIFSRYLEALGNPGDVLLGLSTSGNSMNIIRAAETAREKGMKVIILSGKDGGKLAPFADVELRVSHHGYADRIQEVHIKIIHVLMLLIEKQVVG
jgi:D-sedoheptulose 7-phosphate isomerase